MRTLAVVALAVITGSGVVAQELNQGVLITGGEDGGAQRRVLSTPEDPDAYGTVATTIYKLSAFDLGVFDARAVFATDAFVRRYALSSTATFAPQLWGGLQIPSGVKVVELGAALCDTSATEDLSISLFRNADPSGGATPVSSLQTTGAPGCQTLTVDPNHTVDQSPQTYNIRVTFGSDSTADDSTLGLRSVWVRYQLQVSPAPGSATFLDVPISHTFFRAIEALAASGITSGCGGGNYCPDQNVTRGEVAKFLANALGLHWPN